MLDSTSVHPDSQYSLELWKPIPQFEKYYEVSNLGRIRTTRRRMRYQAGYMLRQYQIPQGYSYVRLSSDDIKLKMQYVHRLVMMAFDPVEGYEKLDVNHQNGQRSDNRLANLEWLSHADNIRYSMDVLGTWKTRATKKPKPPKAPKPITDKLGNGNRKSKFTAEQIQEIRAMGAAGVSQGLIAIKFAISPSYVSMIICNKYFGDA
jgi:hypothetical protein